MADGIMSFATDPGVVTAAYACERLGLPTCPLASGRGVPLLLDELFQDQPPAVGKPQRVLDRAGELGGLVHPGDFSL